MLVLNNCREAFWLGNLKNRDLQVSLGTISNNHLSFCFPTKTTFCREPIAHTYNPGYSGIEIWKIMVQSHSGQIVLKTFLKNTQHKTRLGEWFK
jgi:hypothetical protein